MIKKILTLPISKKDEQPISEALKQPMSEQKPESNLNDSDP